MVLIVGIDLGLSGGVAFMDGGRIVELNPMPVKKSGRGKNDIHAYMLYHQLRQYANEDGKSMVDLAVVERVSAMPKQGVSSTFTFGKGIGKVLAVLEVLGIPVEEPTPQSWKKWVLAGTDKSKEATIGYVQQRFPGVKLVLPGCKVPSHGLADAVCLCEWGRRFLSGGLGNA